MASLCSQSSLDKDESMRVFKFTQIHKQEGIVTIREGFKVGHREVRVAQRSWKLVSEPSCECASYRRNRIL